MSNDSHSEWWPPQESGLCCTLYDIQCICWRDCRCRCPACHH